MSLPLSRYVNIISSVGAPASVNGRALIGRIFTTNPLIPPQTVLTFTNAADFGSYFGTTSEEYNRALVYFSFISKNATSPTAITFSRWVQNAQSASVLGGDTNAKSLATYTAITNGALSINGTTISGINLSSATSLANVATLLQTAISANSNFTGATVSFDATRGGFDLTLPTNGTPVIEPATTGTDLAAPLALITDAAAPSGYDPSIVVTASASAETLTQTLTTSVGESNNFGSFVFIPSLSAQQALEIATWNASQNTAYIFCLPIISANVPAGAAYLPPLQGLSGTAVTLRNTPNTYPEQFPMMILAATDYTQTNAAQNYMFQQDGNFPAEVTDTTTANTMDIAGVNYMGAVQQAGAQVTFYQRGVLTGLSGSPTDINTYANEMWLKDAAAVALVNLQLGTNRVPANTTGVAMVTSILQHSVIDLALVNGTISIGKPLTSQQIVYISQTSGDQNAWYQVKNSGFWLGAVVSVITSDPIPANIGKYQIVYTLIYSKDDDIRFVSGRHILI